MKLKIDQNFFFKGLAIGRDSINKPYLVENGDLFLNEEVEVDIISDRYGKIPQFNVDLRAMVKKFGDDDELIYTKHLKETKLSKENDRIFELDGHWVTPDKEIYSTVELLLKEENLWGQARIKLGNKSRQTVRSRAQIFGMNFTDAIAKVIQTKKERSHYYCEDKRKFDGQGAFADFLVQLNTTKRNVIEVQCWQAIEQEEILTYAHGEIDDHQKVFIHFDCAKHFSSLEEIDFLFKNSSRLNRNRKKKYFRLDGTIDYRHAFNLMKSFFPLDKLIDEYYTVE